MSRMFQSIFVSVVVIVPAAVFFNASTLLLQDAHVQQMRTYTMTLMAVFRWGAARFLNVLQASAARSGVNWG